MNRIWLSIRYEQLKRLMPAIAFVMQSITLSGVLYGLIAWRGIHWYVFPFIVIILIFIGLGFAWFYYDVLKMKDAEQEAQWIMSPQNINVLSPKEQWFYRNLGLAFSGDEKAIQNIIEASERGKI